MFENTIRRWKEKPFLQAKSLTKRLGVIAIIIILVIMGVSNFWFVMLNGTGIVSGDRVGFEFDYGIEDDVMYVDFNLTLLLENPTFMDISSSYMKLKFQNETDEYEIDLISIPAIPANTNLNYSFNFHIDNSTLTEFESIANLIQNATTIAFEAQIGLFWSYIYADGILLNTSLIMGGF